MPLIYLFVLILLTTIIGFVFYKRQNKDQSQGGPISIVKAFWLFFALFQYFLMSAFLYFLTPKNALTDIAGTILLLFIIRGIFQVVMMYGFKLWRPYMGISFNLIALIYVSKKLIDVLIFGPILSMSGLEYIIFLYILLVLFMLVLDSYYAWRFSKIVGNKTIGKEAIWYTSNNNPSFKRINQITAFFNILLLGWFIVILAKLILQF